MSRGEMQTRIGLAPCDEETRVSLPRHASGAETVVAVAREPAERDVVSRASEATVVRGADVCAPSAPGDDRPATLGKGAEARPQRGGAWRKVTPLRAAIAALACIAAALIAVGPRRAPVATNAARLAEPSALAAPRPSGTASHGDAPGEATAPPASPVVAPDERGAVLAVQAGDFDRAAAIYKALAAAHPERRAYAEAARILRSKRAAP